MPRRFFSLTGLLLSGFTSWACSNDSPTREPMAPATAPQSGGGSGNVQACDRLFGRPNEKTGLGADQCAPSCESCGESPYTPATASNERLTRLRELTLRNTTPLLETDPYEQAALWQESSTEVCAVLLAGPQYELATYASRIDAETAGAVTTHTGACGACSSLQDLSVYLEVADLTDPVRRCGVRKITSGVDAIAECISELGFSPECSQIWAYNSLHTREECLDECLDAIDATYHQEDGSPNLCIQCDEEKSGPVFKAVAGRTRRNSGLPTALCRPCQGVARLSHDY